MSQDKVKAAADAMVTSGLAAHGFQYINIDDGWEKGQDADRHVEARNINALFNVGLGPGRDKADIFRPTRNSRT